MTDPLSYLFGLDSSGSSSASRTCSRSPAVSGIPSGRSGPSTLPEPTAGIGDGDVDALRAAGHRSARYTSPHLVDLAERFVIDGRLVDQDQMIAAVADVRAVVEQLMAEGVLLAHPTFFEVTTAVAFELFRRAGVECAVLEVGLGGRLDATNVVEPVATAITSISFDHEQYLGSTLGLIASEKAGIIKPGVPVVVGDLDQEALDAVRVVADERGAPLIRAAAGVTFAPGAEAGVYRVRTAVRDYGNVKLGLRGTHQIGNAVVAISILELLDSRGISVPASAIASALAEPSWPGRLDLRRLPDGREVLFDAAHNPAGAAALASYLRDLGGQPMPLVFAGMRDKDIEGMLRELVPVVGPIIAHPRIEQAIGGADARGAGARLDAHRSITIAGSPVEAVELAWRASPRIIVAGSIFLLGDVMKAARQLMIPFENGS